MITALTFLFWNLAQYIGFLETGKRMADYSEGVQFTMVCIFLFCITAAIIADIRILGLLKK